MKTRISFALLIAGSFLIGACNSNGNESNENGESTDLSGSISIDGSSTVFPLSEAVAEEFRKVQPDVKVTIGSSGSGAGFKKFARGETDISNASRAIKEGEVAACKENNIDFVELRVALDGIAIVVNKENTWLSTITTAELKELWKPDSKVKMWSDLRPDLPAEDITLYGPSTAHGTYDFYTEEIVGESGASRADYNAVADYNVAVQGISSDKNALGYFGLAYYTENADKLKLISVDNGNGPVKPSLETVGDGRYTPLARPLYVYVNRKSLERPEVMAFLKFYVNNATALSKDVGYIPLSSAEYGQVMNKLEAPTQAE